MKKRLFIVLVLILFSFEAGAAVPEGDLLAEIKPGPDGRVDVLTVFAHQDDESIYGGGTLLKMKKDPRVRLYILCLTLGDLSGAMKTLDITAEEQGRIRPAELRLAGAVYDADEVIQFKYHDQGLTDADPEKLAAEIAAVMERVGAEAVITHDPSGITGHPDHVAGSRAATMAFERSSAQRLYYTTMPPSLSGMRFLLGKEAAENEPARPTVKVDIRAERKLKRLAMYSHVTQHEFSDIGLAMAFIGRYNHEWFALGQSK